MARSKQDLPGAVTTMCPECEQATLHSVLTGKVSGKGGAMTLDATVQCTRCETTHHALIKQSADAELPVVLSAGGTSHRTKLTLPGDDEIHIGDTFIVDGSDAKLTGIEAKDTRRVEAAAVKDVLTLWMKRFDVVNVGFAINLDKKTIAKDMTVEPDREFRVGEEFVFGRLRVTVHAIKTEERLLKRGSSPASEIRRIFAAPTHLARQEHRPDKRTREQLRDKEFKKEQKDAQKGAERRW